MKRALTGIAAAAIVLGTAAPMAFADSSSSALTAAGQKSFVFNGQTVSNPYIMTGVDSGNTTSFAPIYYFDQLLNDAGITATWNGNTHTWALSDSSLDASTIAANIAGGLGTGNTTITLNGTPIKKINTQVAQDPAAKKGVMTTYFPVYYVQTLFQAIGINAVWNGSTGLTVTTAQPGLNVTVTGSTIGDGSAANPYINESGASQTVAAKLVDSTGNPVANATLDLTITGAKAPNIQQGSNYETLSAGSNSYTWTTTVTTDSTGVATFTVAGEGAYTITISGTNAEANDSTTISLANANGDPILTPSYTSVGFSSAANSTAGVVPVTVTLPESGSTPAANQEVTFYLPTNSGAVFTNSNGQQIGTTDGANYVYTAYTNSNGQATAYVNAYTAGTVTVGVESGAAVASPSLASNTAVINYAAPSTSTTNASALSLSGDPTAFYNGFENQNLKAAYVNSLSGIADNSPAYVAPLTGTSATDTVQTGSVTYNLAFASGQDLSDLYLDNKSNDFVSVSDLPTAATETSTVQLTATWNSGGYYNWYVNGVELSETTNTDVFGFDVSAAGTTTVTSGSASATVAFTNGTVYPAYSQYVTPNSTTITNGSPQTIQFQVLDTSGDPVANQMVPIAYDPTQTAGLWVTAVNGVTLSETVTAGSNFETENTPIPLFAASGLGYTTVSVPNAAVWTTSGKFEAETDKNGNVILTLGSEGVPYWSASGPAFSTETAGSTKIFTDFGSTSTTEANTYGVVYLGASAPSGYTATPQQVGSISW